MSRRVQKQGERADNGKDRASDLRISGIGRLLLGLKVEALMRCGPCCAVLAALGLSRGFDNHDRKCLGCGVAGSVSLLGATFFYGWAWTGHPQRFWGLL